MNNLIVPDFASLYIPYGYHNGDPVKYQELVSKARRIIELAKSPEKEHPATR